MRQWGGSAVRSFDLRLWLRPWAYTLGAILEIIALVLALLQLGRSDLGRHILTIVLAGIVLLYLATPRVRAAFGRSSARALLRPAEPATILDGV